MRRATYCFVAVALLGAYGYSSLWSFRLALKGHECLRGGLPMTARHASLFVLGRHPFSLAVPAARACLLRAESDGGPAVFDSTPRIWTVYRNANAPSCRLAERIGGLLSRGVSEAVGKVFADGGDGDFAGAFSPLTLDMAPLLFSGGAVVFTLALLAAFFLRSKGSLGGNLFTLALCLLVMAWVVGDAFPGLRLRILDALGAGSPSGLIMAYDYLKYALGGALFIQALRRWFHVRWRWSHARGAPA